MQEMTRLLHTIYRHMANWQRNAETASLYALLNRAIVRHKSADGVAPDLVPYLYAQLDAYTNDPRVAPQARLKAGLLQHHISAYLPEHLSGDDLGLSEDLDELDQPIETAESLPPPSEAESPSSTPENETLEVPRQPAVEDTAAPWETLEATLKDLRDLKRMWAMSLIDLIKGGDSLEKRLSPAAANDDSVDKNRKAKKADKLEDSSSQPDLPDFLLPRTLFERQVRVEMERSKRHGNPLALALIGIERIDELKKKHGPELITSIQRQYQEIVLANFRAYDFITRFDDHRFALLFPDTKTRGAQRALEKARKRAQESYLTFDTDTLSLPGFIGGLTAYERGETYEEWLARAQAAYARAQTMTKGKIVCG